MWGREGHVEGDLEAVGRCASVGFRCEAALHREIWEVYVDSGQRRERNHGP